MFRHSCSRATGFTLIELIIVVAVLGILAAIAYPSYQEQVRKGKRTDATSSLLAAAQQLERCYTQYNAYNHVNCGVAGTLQSAAGLPSGDGEYTLKLGAISASAYTLTAQPATGSTQADDGKCKGFSYTSTGVKDITAGSSGSAEYCW